MMEKRNNIKLTLQAAQYNDQTWLMDLKGDAGWHGKR